MPFNFQPVIIIGAARSGTNMLRDLLTKIHEVSSWPCDEINYIWRYGNAQFPTDELQPENAGQANKKYIRRCFANEANRTRTRWLIEKTCANSLRVNFVDTIIPEAKYIFLVRNGFDVVASAEKRWHAPLDIGYLAQKVGYIPWRDIPYYGARYASHRLTRMLSSERRLPTWGPRFSGIDKLVATTSATEVCAHQWQQSVLLASETLHRMPSKRVHTVSYEAFVKSPEVGLSEIVRFLDIPFLEKQCQKIILGVSSKSVGRGRECTNSRESGSVISLLQETHELLARQWPELYQLPADSNAA